MRGNVQIAVETDISRTSAEPVQKVSSKRLAAVSSATQTAEVVQKARDTNYTFCMPGVVTVIHKCGTKRAWRYPSASKSFAETRDGVS